MFVDKVTVRCKAGRGGDGSCSFRREKFIPRGGPDGGDGGKGGDVIVIARDKVPHLGGIRNLSTFRAGHGESGGKSRKFGKGGEDSIIEVPAGTRVTDKETGEELADLIANGQKFVVAKGGKGGKGNVHFATPTNRVPQRSDPGLDGDEIGIKLELFIPADAAIMGLPWSGKSAIHRKLTGSNPRHSGFEFATRNPHIGVCVVNPYSRFTILDLPSLCDGSSEGQGLGNKFLKHLRRASINIFVLDASSPTPPKEQMEIIKREVAAFDPSQLEKRSIVVLTKSDLAEKEPKGIKRLKPMCINAETGEGIPALIETIAVMLGLEM